MSLVSRISIRAGLACLFAATLVVSLGAWGGLQLACVSAGSLAVVVWSVTGVWATTALSLLPLTGWQRSWLPPLAMLTSLSELLPRSGISAPLLGCSLVAFAVVTWAHRPERHAVRAIAVLAGGACLAAVLVCSER